jgi:hypothetical protein
VTNHGSRWLVPALGLVLGLLIALAELAQHASPIAGVTAFAIVFGYTLVVAILQSRSETAQLLSGLSIDERWDSIHQRAQASTAQIMAAVLVGTFIVVEFAGGDAMPYAGMAAVFGIAYLGSILWYRWRS